MKTLVLDEVHTHLENLPHDIRHEIRRGQREGLVFKEISQEEHENFLRMYRKRKGLEMPPFYRKIERKYYGIFDKNGAYCCSAALFPHDNRLVIQGVSIGEKCPYYAFTFFIYKCLTKAIAENYKGLDLAGEGKWKRKWMPKEAHNTIDNIEYWLHWAHAKLKKVLLSFLQ